LELVTAPEGRKSRSASFAPPGLRRKTTPPPGLRPELHSVAAPRLTSPQPQIADHQPVVRLFGLVRANLCRPELIRDPDLIDPQHRQLVLVSIAPAAPGLSKRITQQRLEEFKDG